MSDNTPGFLNDELLNTPDTPAPAAAPAAAVTTPEPAPAPAAPAVAPPAAPQPSAPMVPAAPAAPGTPTPEQHMVPLTVVLDTRDKLKESQARLADYERREEEARRSKEQQEAIPDMFTDPEGYHNYVVQQAHRTVQTQLLNQNLNATAQRVGAEAFEAAYEAVLKAGPAVIQKCLASHDPGQAMLDWHKRETVLSGLPETFFANPDAFVRSRYAELAAQAAQPAPGAVMAPQPAAPAAVSPQPAAPAAPPPSLASAPGSAGAFQEQVPESAFAYAFG